MTAPDSTPSMQFSGYQKRVVAMLAFLQFAVILDFMLMAPLGALIMPALSVSPAQFGTVVSAYAFAAGVSANRRPGDGPRWRMPSILRCYQHGATQVSFELDILTARQSPGS